MENCIVGSCSLCYFLLLKPVSILEHALKAQTSEAPPETSPFSELHPSGNLQYSYDATERQFARDIVKDQEVQPSDQLLLAVPIKRGRRRKRSLSQVSENSDLDLSKSLLPQRDFKLPVTPRRSARKRAQKLLANADSPSTQGDTRSGGRVEILDTPQRRTRRVPRAEPEKMDTHEQTPAQPNEESTAPRTAARTGRRGRKRRSILEESTGEEAFRQGPGGSPLLLEDINPSGRDKRPRP
ncbi:uncharacterized protein RDI95_000262 [Morus bassanus]